MTRLLAPPNAARRRSGFQNSDDVYGDMFRAQIKRVDSSSCIQTCFSYMKELLYFTWKNQEGITQEIVLRKYGFLYKNKIYF